MFQPSNIRPKIHRSVKGTLTIKLKTVESDRQICRDSVKMRTMSERTATPKS
jgi:hypothetical protein